MCVSCWARGDETIFFLDLLFLDYRRCFVALCTILLYTREICPGFPFRDDYRNSLISHPSGAPNNEKTSITHTRKDPRGSREGAQCCAAAFPHCSALYIRSLPPLPPLLRGDFLRRHFRPEIQM